MRTPTHRCNVCGALWIRHPDGMWSLFSALGTAGKCCDNAPMGAQIEPLVSDEGLSASMIGPLLSGVIRDIEATIGRRLRDEEILSGLAAIGIRAEVVKVGKE